MLTILVVEDDPNTRKLICAILKQNGFASFSASDGFGALTIMDQEHIDLVVLDLMMPGMNGYELTKELRSAYESLPILMVSAKQAPLDKKLGFLAGTDDYMTKPFDQEEMILRIRALLRRAQIANDNQIQLGEVTLDYNSLTLQRPGETITLPQKEFYLLYKLLASPNMIFTKLQLMDEIWGMDSETDDHTIIVHINRLRERLREWPEFEIVTIRGLGYKAVKKI